ncbi:MAG: hypothetical protein ACI87J_002064 [Colwellia sp.]|jgi:hypothetical protein
MQPNKRKLALVIGTILLGASSASNAQEFTVAVSTITDVTIATKTGHDLDFGESIVIAPNTICTMTGNLPLFSDVNIVHSTPLGGTQGLLNGTGCVGDGTTVAKPGIYEVQGEPGLTLSLTISETSQFEADGVTPANYTFKPNSGCFTAYNGTATADQDTCSGYTMGAADTAIKLPVSDLAETEGNTGIVTPGMILFTVGGEVGIGPAGLVANQTYATKFQVDVTY